MAIEATVREMRFRRWNEELQQWLYFDLDERHFEYIGLQDKNHVDIFEGDVLSSNVCSYDGVVHYLDGQWWCNGRGLDQSTIERDLLVVSGDIKRRPNGAGSQNNEVAGQAL